MPDDPAPPPTELSPRAREILTRIEHAAAPGEPLPVPVEPGQPGAGPAGHFAEADETDRLLALINALSARTEAARRQLEELTAALELLTERLARDVAPSAGTPAGQIATPSRRAYDLPAPPAGEPPPASPPAPPLAPPPPAPGYSPLRRPAAPPAVRWPADRHHQ